MQGAALAELAALPPEHAIEVETNGTVEPHPRFDPYVDQYNVSPKLSHSGNPATLALLPPRMRQWASEPRAFFKFVIGAPDDLDEVLALQARYALPAERIYLMPEGRSSVVLRERMTWLAELCEAHAFRLTDRMHIHLWGDTRGT